MFASTPKLLNSTLPVASTRVSDARVVTLGLLVAMKSPSIFSTPLSSMIGSLSVATAMTPAVGQESVMRPPRVWMRTGLVTASLLLMCCDGVKLRMVCTYQ